MNPVTKTRLTIVAIAAMFMVPLCAALFLNSQWSDWAPGSTKNKGRLLQPPPEMPAGLTGLESDKWKVLYLDETCLEACLEKAQVWQRLYRAAGRDMDKLQTAIVVRAAVTPSVAEQLAKVAPNVAILPAAASWFDAVSDKLGAPVYGHALIADRRGYIALDYADADPLSVQKDLDRLVTWTKE